MNKYFIEGISHNPYEQFDSEENRKRYEIEQEQRAWERKIRKQKRKVEGLKAGLDKEDPSRALETTEKLRKEEKKLAQMRKDYKAFSEANGLKEQTHRLEIEPDRWTSFGQYLKRNDDKAPQFKALASIHDNVKYQEVSELNGKQFNRAGVYDAETNTVYVNSRLNEWLEYDRIRLLSHELAHAYDESVLGGTENAAMFAETIKGAQSLDIIGIASKVLEVYCKRYNIYHIIELYKYNTRQTYHRVRLTEYGHREKILSQVRNAGTDRCNVLP